MKKLLAALALSVMLTATAHAQQPQTDRDFDGLKGPVKSVTVETATLKKHDGQYVKEPRSLAERVMYNANGNRADDEWYDENDGTLMKKSTYRYIGGKKLAEGQLIIPILIVPSPGQADDNTQPARAPASFPHSMRSISEKYEYKYDARGRIREMIIKEHGRVTNRVVYVYKGNRKETRSYVDEGQMVYRQVDTLDARGNLIESTSFDPEAGAANSKYSYTAYEFDARGNWIKRLKTGSAAGEPEMRVVEYQTITYF
jgi:hypothetical protein